MGGTTKMKHTVDIIRTNLPVMKTTNHHIEHLAKLKTDHDL
jgi:hypothetical protein